MSQILDIINNWVLSPLRTKLYIIIKIRLNKSSSESTWIYNELLTKVNEFKINVLLELPLYLFED